MPNAWNDVNFLHAGHYERSKAGVHGMALGLFAVMGVYNAAAWLDREDCEMHLMINAMLYGLLAGYEVRQIARHLDCGVAHDPETPVHTLRPRNRAA